MYLLKKTPAKHSTVLAVRSERSQTVASLRRFYLVETYMLYLPLDGHSCRSTHGSISTTNCNKGLILKEIEFENRDWLRHVLHYFVFLALADRCLPLKRLSQCMPLQFQQQESMETKLDRYGEYKVKRSNCISSIRIRVRDRVRTMDISHQYSPERCGIPLSGSSPKGPLLLLEVYYWLVTMEYGVKWGYF